MRQIVSVVISGGTVNSHDSYSLSSLMGRVYRNLAPVPSSTRCTRNHFIVASGGAMNAAKPATAPLCSNQFQLTATSAVLVLHPWLGISELSLFPNVLGDVAMCGPPHVALLLDVGDELLERDDA